MRETPEEREVPGARLFAETTAPPIPEVNLNTDVKSVSLPPIENEELIRHELTTNKVGGPVPVEAPKTEPGAPDPVDVLLAEIGMADTTDSGQLC